MKKFVALLLCFITLFCSCKNEINENIYNDNLSEKSENLAEIIAVWINCYEFAQLIKSSENAEEFEKEVETVIDNCKQYKINRIFLQVRPYADAFYQSDIFPYSNVVEGIDKKIKQFDVLKSFCKIAHVNNISIDAWINPYRISSKSDDKSFNIGNFVSKEYKISKNDISYTDEGIYFNPASIKAKKLVLDGIRELIEKYDVDGIHIDDYFYPTTDLSFDKKEYDAYISEGGILSVEKWRRENVNALVSEMYSTVKSFNESLIFSVSPCADIEKNENELYADVKLWCSQEGYADLIIPQLYYGFNNDSLPFSKTADEWNALFDNSSVKFCVGIAPYKCGEIDNYAGSGKDEWVNNSNILLREIEYISSLQACCGYSFYSYSHIILSKSKEFKKIELQNVINMI